MHKLTGRQCKQARSLLRWNLNELAAFARNVSSKRIERFEHNALQLQVWECETLHEVFTDNGVVFTENFEVKLVNQKKDDKH